MGRAQHLKSPAPEETALGKESRGPRVSKVTCLPGLLRKSIPCMGLNFMFRNTATLDKQEDTAFTKTVSVKPTRPRSPCGLALLGVLARKSRNCNYRVEYASFLRGAPRKAACSVWKCRKDGHAALPTLRGAALWGPWATQPAPRFQSTHNAQVSTVLQAFIAARNCSPGPL